jgi:predicted O-methyltransferase YrrM
MNQEQWTAVDRYITELLVPADAVLEAALQASAAAGLPPISVSPNEGKLLHLLARMQGARRILEIGTLGGYSTIWLARALPAGGQLVTLEVEARPAEVACSNFAFSG